VSSPEHAAYERLIADHVAGRLDAAESAALAGALEADAGLRRMLALQLAIDRGLRQMAAPGVDVERIMRALPLRRSQPLPQRVLGQIARGEEDRRHRRLLLPMAAAALLMITAGLVPLLAGRLARPLDAPGETFAILRSGAGAVWTDGQPPCLPVSGRLTGTRLDLRAGLAEVELPSGAQLVIEGPTRLDLTGRNGARLLLGRVSAYVPEAAHGFVLQGEGVTIVDLGTAFALAQGEDSQAEVHVFTGEVEAQARVDGGSIRRQLPAGEAVRVDPRGGTLVPIPCDPFRFARSLRPLDIAIDLADLAAGGDGRGSAAADGIDPLTGRIVTGPAIGVTRDGVGAYRRVAGSAVIDGVFIPDGRSGETTLTSAGHRFLFPPSDGNGYDLIRRGGTLDDPRNGGTPEHPRIPPVFGGIDFRAPGHAVLGMHANVGMTVDLEELARSHPGLRVERFTAQLANVGRKGGRGIADFWLFLDGRRVAHHAGLTTDSPVVAIDLRLAPGERYLTLVSTDHGDGSGLDWITLGDPVLHLSAAP
jgi:hypothetical protein